MNNIAQGTQTISRTLQPEHKAAVLVLVALTCAREEKKLPARHQDLQEGRKVRPVALATPVALIQALISDTLLRGSCI